MARSSSPHDAQVASAQGTVAGWPSIWWRPGCGRTRRAGRAWHATYPIEQDALAVGEQGAAAHAVLAALAVGGQGAAALGAPALGARRASPAWLRWTWVSMPAALPAHEAPFFFCPFDSNGLLSVILICSCIKYWTDEYVTLYCRLTQITAYVQMPLTGAGPIPACEKHCRRKNSSLLSIFTCTTHQPFSLLSINLTTNPSSLLYAWVNIHRPHDQVSRNIALSVHPENGSDRGTTTYRARNNEE
jgi:hypothetical protein